MNTDEKTALAMRAIACSGWEDRPGMVNLQGYRFTDEDFAGRHLPNARRLGLPDFDDEATRGCLLGLVRKAWRDPGAHVARSFREWEPRTGIGTTWPGREWLMRQTEAEALVAALEAGSKKKRG